MSNRLNGNRQIQPVFVLRHVEFGTHIKWLLLRLGTHGYEPFDTYDSLADALSDLVKCKTNAT